MATFNPKHFSNADVLRTIDPARLLDLLKPHEDYLNRQGLSLPSAQQAAVLDIDRLADLLETPDETAPQQLLNAIGYIDEMSTTQAMDKLLSVAIEAGMKFDHAKQHSPADVAVQVWLFDPSIVIDQHAWHTWRSPRRMDCFRPDGDTLKTRKKLTVARIKQGEKDLSDWLHTNNRSSFCNFSVRTLVDRIQVSIQRGDPFTRKPTIENDAIQNIHYRPAGKDTVVLRLADHMLECNTSIRRALPIYCRVFGTMFFGDPEYFSESKIVSLAFLEEYGEEAVSWGDVDEIEQIYFVEYQVDLGGDQNATMTYRADDILADLATRDKKLHFEGRLKDATFKVKFRGTHPLRTVKVYDGNATCYTRDANATFAEQWLKLRNFIIESNAKVGVEVDDKALASA
ncbi:hypothetical protein FYK55_18190 [Roseiconus nitratireducens]|uniref:Uncharacterized protein n=1 Tax=Roseiconus nitratireducens TaxID=2605748 RepID=A0A5M6D209_9BACT|nr:hypothetical protein [Roseiconus nitratireducens]KAA5541488.1 hypothetical protein FYK55_18190 [Roseiconus nitratireducens]